MDTGKGAFLGISFFVFYALVSNLGRVLSSNDNFIAKLLTALTLTIILAYLIKKG